MKTIFLLFLALSTVAWAAEPSPRRELSLDGVWQIAEGRMDQPPAAFDRTVPVPGLVTLATPAFSSPPGPVVSDRYSRSQKDPARDAFWYRRTFRLDGPVPAVARLKIHKAMFGSKAILNGNVLGEHPSSFTPGWFDARAALKSGENVLLIRVGADRDALPPGVPAAFDPEKIRYIPGIFDSVELILSGTPHFLHVQTAPDLASRSVRVQAVLRNDRDDDNGEPVLGNVTFVVREAKSGRIAGRVTRGGVAFEQGADTTVDVRIPIDDCRLWSPEDPFLYRLEADSSTDRFETRFGMREFRFDPATRHAVLNGKPYFMRGSNITLYRFFEDSACKDLPWRADWVRRLHERVKDMHWNTLRYCIGFPPEAWYDAADELGILIQDEFSSHWSEPGQSDAATKEYAAWMRERWNHPSVVIWDARNEGHKESPVSGAALTAVRGLDLSDRPWDNGYGECVGPADPVEAHPYHFLNFSGRRFTLADFPRANPMPLRSRPSPQLVVRGTIDQVGANLPKGLHWQPGDEKHAVIINEYGGIWLNRDGSPTTLSADFYHTFLGENATAAQRFHLYATLLAAESEFWRSHRKVAAVLHFVALASSRSDGQTSDHWSDVEKLTWEPEFERYVRDAFAPVGLMLDFWGDTGISGKSTRIPVRLINDLEKPWSGAVTLRLRRADGGPVLLEQRQDCRLGPYGDATVNFGVTWPAPAGPCLLEAELPGTDGKPVRSIRDLAVVDSRSLGLAFGKKTSASSSRSPAGAPGNAVDGDPTTWWSSTAEDPSWLVVDLGDVRRINRVRINWAITYSTAFTVQASRDGQTWTDLFAEENSKGGVSEIRFAPVDARHVRISCTKRTRAQTAMEPGHAIRELHVFE
ncbi:MAG: discoidin domain-containing protein [Opitutaceae bacterium]|nr:discoidin domain-containing protein [Opitutaceae bacterium]